MYYPAENTVKGGWDVFRITNPEYPVDWFETKAEADGFCKMMNGEK